MMNENITRRDYFAAHAMQALLIRGWIGDSDSNIPIHYSEDSANIEAGDSPGLMTLARDAYTAADAMIIASEPQKDE